jgi:hypothetical protein
LSPASFQTLGRFQGTVTTRSESPDLVRVTTPAAAGTKISLEGYRLGANLSSGVRVQFSQGTKNYFQSVPGGSFVVANVQHGWQSLGVVVPRELQPGPCQVAVDVEGRFSQAVTIIINPPAAAPVLSAIKPHYVGPGELIWIEGTGFSESDDLELTDSAGRVYVQRSQITSSPDTDALKIPADIPDGEVTLRVIERRSGTNAAGNALMFMVTRGPKPLEVADEWLMPVAPGQWLDLPVRSEDPINSADRIEILFAQSEQLHIIPLANPKILRVQVPRALLPGNVQIRMRTWVGGKVSQWSVPTSFRLLNRAAAPKIYSLEIVPVRAEVGFKQGDRILSIVTVNELDYPRVRIPIEMLSQTLSRGQVQIITRVWRGGQPSEWLQGYGGFQWPTTFVDGKSGTLRFVDRIYVGPDTPVPILIYRGESLRLQGTFPVESVDKLGASLESAGHAPVVLNPTEVGYPREAKIQLPHDLEDAEWQLTIRNPDDGAALRLPIRLRLTKER